jgi:hypothetical protein
MKVGIIGSRGFDNEAKVQEHIDHLVGRYFEDEARMVVFIGGGSRGAERIAQDHITNNLNMDYVLFKPYNFIDTKVPHDPKFFHFRNKQIVDNADLLVVFDDGVEKSLVRTILYIKNILNKDYIIYHKDGTYEQRGEITNG